MTAHDQIVNLLESTVRYMYRWLTENDEILGKIVYVLHLAGFWTLITLIFLSHVFPYFWFQVGVFVVVLLTWIQHVVLNTCVLTSLEIKFIGENVVCMTDSLLSMFNIPVTLESRMGVTVMLSTVMTCFLGLELMSRCIMHA
jgi:hypothetical protein